MTPEYEAIRRAVTGQLAIDGRYEVLRAKEIEVREAALVR
jgi:hypothetical protein